jgi:hypothetical protein
MASGPVGAPDIYIYSDPKKNKIQRKVGKAKPKGPSKYKATEKDVERRKGASKVV